MPIQSVVTGADIACMVSVWEPCSACGYPLAPADTACDECLAPRAAAAPETIARSLPRAQRRRAAARSMASRLVPDPTGSRAAPLDRLTSITQAVLVTMAALAATGAAAVVASAEGGRVTLPDAFTKADPGGRIHLSPMIYVPQAMTWLVWGMFVIWLIRANANLRLWVHGRRFPTWWLVAGFFVPIYSLAHPLRAMNDVWRGSDPTNVPGSSEWRHRLPFMTFVIAWSLWLAASLCFTLVVVPDALERPAGADLTLRASPTVACLALVSAAGYLAAYAIGLVADRQRIRRRGWLPPVSPV